MWLFRTIFYQLTFIALCNCTGNTQEYTKCECKSDGFKWQQAKHVCYLFEKSATTNWGEVQSHCAEKGNGSTLPTIDERHGWYDQLKQFLRSHESSSKVRKWAINRKFVAEGNQYANLKLAHTPTSMMTSNSSTRSKICDFMESVGSSMHVVQHRCDMAIDSVVCQYPCNDTGNGSRTGPKVHETSGDENDSRERKSMLIMYGFGTGSLVILTFSTLVALHLYNVKNRKIDSSLSYQEDSLREESKPQDCTAKEVTNKVVQQEQRTDPKTIVK